MHPFTKCILLLCDMATDEGIACALPYGSGKGRVQFIKAIMQQIATSEGAY
ncbi:hypothetical protein [Xanthocytophaga flavus]|uniref:hypothetical protein n=1 Tax=Xanthocytophaga flava TaxID=3048013 RepID=UPI0028D46018|nr:hypothetical protein [Xanthocytophaga flavus]